MNKLVQLNFFFLILLSSCIQKTEAKKTREIIKSSYDSIKIHYAKGFHVDYFKGGKFVQVFHPKTNELLDEILLITDPKAEIPNQYQNNKTFQLPIQKYVSQSTTHISFLDKINELEGLQAVSWIELVRNKNAVERIKQEQILSLNQGAEINLELLIDLDPELIFMYPFDQSSIDKVKEHLHSVLTTEYLEMNPLAKAEWIKFFALFYNKEREANLYFEKVKNAYEALKQDKKTVSCFLNLPYQNNWNCPPGNSYTVALLNDAGIRYHFEDKKQSENLKLQFEEVLDQCLEEEYWIIFANRTSGFKLDHLANENRYYKDFKAFKNGNIIFCNTATSDYFGDALVEPHILLQNLIEVVSKEKDSTQYFYRLDD